MAKPVALITGAGQRIGSAIAHALAQDGYAVGVHYRSSSTGAGALVESIIENGGDAATLQADLTDRDAVRALVPACEVALGPVTCLVNNASVFEKDSIEDMDDALWDAHMQMHVHTPITLIGQMAKRLPRGRQAVAINIIDQRVWRLTPEFLSYTLSKSTLWTATRTLAQALAPSVRVCGIGPGPTLANTRQAPEDFQAQIDNVILKRGPDLSEITNAVRFILETPSLTGQMIALDGGQHLAWETPDVIHANE
ncbi:MAG: SDR family oxidoreductase [Pseudomonadota bacterium]